MANNRDSSKQKRARQNRAQREAREARAKAASEPAEARKAKYASSTPASTGDSKPKKKGFFAAPDGDRPARPPRPGDRPVDLDTLEGSWIRKRLMVPGGRQVLTGAALTVFLTVLLLFQKFPEANDPRGSKAPRTETLIDLVGFWAIPLVLVPLIAMGLAAHFILSPHRRRIWIATAVIVSLEVPLGFPFYLFPAGFVIYGYMRSNKIEGPSPSSRAGRAAAAAEADASSSDVDDED